MSKKMYLPSRWAICTIEEVVAFDGVFTDGDWIESKDQDPNGDVRLIQLADIGDGKFQNKSARFLTKKKAYDLNCTFLIKGDLLVARMPDPLGRCCMFPLSGDEAYVTVVDVCAVRLGPSPVSYKYMMYLINSPEIRSAISVLQSGSTRKRISRKNLATIELPLAPVAEQHRIVAKIEELFSELDKGIESLKTAREQLKVYRQAVLKHAFEGKFTARWREENKGKLETADQLLVRIQKEREARYQQQVNEWKKAVKKWEAEENNGKKPSRPSKSKIIPSPKLDKLDGIPSIWGWSNFCSVTYKIGDIDHKMPKDSDEGYPYLSTGNISSDGTMDFSNAKIISEADYSRLALKIKPEKGDVIFPRYGTIGRNVLVNFDKDFLVSYSCAIVKNIHSLLNEKYVYYFSLSPVTKSEIRRYVKETTQANIGIASIEKFVFPLCSYREQTKIVEILESHLSVLDKQEKQIEDSLLASESLRQSILKKAFSGQLVAQDPNDEPAAVLLERIKAEKTAQTSTRKLVRKRKPRRKEAI